MKKTGTIFTRILCVALMLLCVVLFGCRDEMTDIYDEITPLAGNGASASIKNEAKVLPAQAAISNKATAVASGVKTKSNSEAVIDFSNTADGYVMVKYCKDTDKKLKAQVKGPKTTYTFNLEPNEWAAFPLADENGSYKVTVFKNASGTKYATVLSLKMNVKLSDSFAPFLHSNQYVDFDSAPDAVALAEKMCGDMKPLDAVAKIYTYVTENIKYDTELAKNVKSGYLPVLDNVLKSGKGICFDYAALMTGMLRSLGIPCKLVVGYAGDAYHAWISVYTKETGWIDKVVYFDGKNWQRMDPTFASNANGDKKIMEFIGDGNNYSAKYIY